MTAKYNTAVMRHHDFTKNRFCVKLLKVKIKFIICGYILLMQYLFTSGFTCGGRLAKHT